jgi:hypothetical protein
MFRPNRPDESTALTAKFSGRGDRAVRGLRRRWMRSIRRNPAFQLATGWWVPRRRQDGRGADETTTSGFYSHAGVRLVISATGWRLVASTAARAPAGRGSTRRDPSRQGDAP